MLSELVRVCSVCSSGVMSWVGRGLPVAVLARGRSDDHVLDVVVDRKVDGRLLHLQLLVSTQQGLLGVRRLARCLRIVRANVLAHVAGAALASDLWSVVNSRVRSLVVALSLWSVVIQARLADVRSVERSTGNVWSACLVASLLRVCSPLTRLDPPVTCWSLYKRLVDPYELADEIVDVVLVLSAVSTIVGV